MRRLAAAAAFAAVMVLAAGTALAWFAPVEGPPQAMLQGDARGFFIWHDWDGVHLRVHTKMFALPFSGVIKTDGHFAQVHGKKLEFGDHYWLNPVKNTLTFKFMTAAGMDGLDFKVMGGSHLSFDLRLNGQPINPAEIYVGHEGWRPSSHHFMLRR
jgi:hypothetical protein